MYFTYVIVAMKNGFRFETIQKSSEEKKFQKFRLKSQNPEFNYICTRHLY